MDYVNSDEAVKQVALAGEKKTHLSAKKIVISGILSGALLSIATTLAFNATIQTGLPIVGALIFPTGFVLISLLNLELVTGSFAVVPLSYMRNKAKMQAMIRYLVLAFIGNLIGSLIYAALFTLSATEFGTIASSPMIDQVIQATEGKTLAYQSIGAKGLMVVFIRAILCNWMVATGAVIGSLSKSTIGKIVAMWLPILIFFGQGFEHLVVNMSVIPMGMMMGANVGMAEWWLWNLIPVTIGNIVGALLFVAIPLHIIKEKD